jgi:uncharacterized protein (TIGR02145 family)
MKIFKFLGILCLFLLSQIGCTVSDSEMFDLLKEMNSQNKELLEEVKSLKSKSDSLINEIKANSAKQEELLNKVIALQAEIGKVVQEITKLSEELKNQGADIDSIKAQLSDLQKKYEQIIVQLEQLQSLSKILGEIENLKAQLLELNKKYESVILSLGQNKDQIDQLKTKIDAIQKQLEENLSKISQLTAQLSNSDANVESILAQIAELQKKVNDLLTNFQELLGVMPEPQGTVTSLDCISIVNVGNLVIGQAASNATIKINYQGGNGKGHLGQTVSSTGVTGLTATLSSGTFATGNGTLTYVITGNPASSGLAKFAINIGGKTCEISRSVASANSNISALNCNTAVNTGATGPQLNKLVKGYSIPGAKSTIAYLGGDGSNYAGQVINSTGVTGLQATLSAGIFNFGSGNLVLSISGTPTSSGKANFQISVGGQTCILSWDVNDNQASKYPNGTVFCEYPTEVIEIVSAKTGRIWMDRNLGARRSAINSQDILGDDSYAFGDLYQWGRRADGHQCRNSNTRIVDGGVNVDQPNHGDFILPKTPSSPNPQNNWRSPANPNLWNGVNGINNPCPEGFRIPTKQEWLNEMATGTGYYFENGRDINNSTKLNFTIGGNRLHEHYENGKISFKPVGADYFVNSRYHGFDSSGNNDSYYSFPIPNGFSAGNGVPALGSSIRCIKN